MTLLHAALGAAGLACVSIPILIHLLLRRRRRPVQWAAMRFLLEAYRRQRNRLKLQQFILLVTRCLILALFALAVGRLVLDASGVLGAGAGRDVYIVIDTSLASSVRDASGQTAIERHRQRAEAIIDALGPGDRAALIATGAPAHAIVGAPSSDVAAVRALVAGVAPTDAACDTAGALEEAARLIRAEDETRDARIVLLSDFLAGSADTARRLPPVLEDLPRVRLGVFPPLDAAPANVQITSVEPLNPVMLTGSGGVSRGEQVRVTLRRTGPLERADTTLRVRTGTGEDERIAPPVTRIVRWSAGQGEQSVTVQIDASTTAETHAGADTLLVAEIDRDAVEGDNLMRRPVGVREALRVGIVARRRFDAARRLDQMRVVDWLRLALNPSQADPIDVLDIEPGAIDAPTLASVDVAIVPAPDLVTEEGWDMLAGFARAGGMVLITPPAQATVHLWPDSVARAMGVAWTIAREVESHEDAPLHLADEQPPGTLMAWIDAEMQDLVKPVSVLRILPVLEAPDAQRVLVLEDGRPWLVALRPGAERSDDGAPVASDRGLLVYLASAPTLSWTNLPARPLMVPLVQETVRQGFGRSVGTWASVAGAPIAAPSRTQRVRLLPDASRELEVSPAGTTSEPVRRAGVWRAVDRAGRERGLVAVNPDTNAGRTDVQAQSLVDAWLAGARGGATPGQTLTDWIDAEAPGAVLARGSGDSPWSRPLLVAVLVLAAAETLLARLFSYAQRERRSAGTQAPAAPA